MAEKVKIALIGDAKVGKTSFIQRFCTGQFKEKRQKPLAKSYDIPEDIEANTPQKGAIDDPNGRFGAYITAENLLSNYNFTKNFYVFKQKHRCPFFNCSAIYSFPTENNKVREKIVDVTFFDVPRLQKFPVNSLEEWELDGAIGVRSADVFILLYDVTNETSFDYVTQLRCEILEVEYCFMFMHLVLFLTLISTYPMKECNIFSKLKSFLNLNQSCKSGWARVRAGFRPKLDKNFGLNSGLRRTFVLGAQKYNQNNIATLLNFSDLT